MFGNLSYHKVTNRYAFDIYGVDLAIVNGIRRTLLSGIPILGFRFHEHRPSITIRKNTGRLHDEFLAHRLSLIPLHFGESTLEAFQADDFTFELKVRNDSLSMLDVTTRHFTGSHRGTPLGPEELQAIFPCNVVSGDPVLITRLRPNEELDVVAVPVLSTAKEHAAFMPVSLSSFSYLPDPAAARGGASRLDAERRYAKNAYGDPAGFRFELEPTTGLKASYLVSKALEILVTRALAIRTELFHATSATVSLQANEQGGADLSIEGEDDTVGHLIQSLMFNHFVRDHARTEAGRHVSFVGYYAPHPLQTAVVVRAAFDGCEGASMSEYRALFAQGLDLVMAQVKDVLDAWRTFVAC